MTDHENRQIPSRLQLHVHVWQEICNVNVTRVRSCLTGLNIGDIRASSGQAPDK